MPLPKSKNLYHESRNKILGDFLRKHRERLKATTTGLASSPKNGSPLKKFTQTEVACYLGVKRSFINKIENGRYRPARDFLEQLCQLYNIDVERTLFIAGYADIDMLQKVAKSDTFWKVVSGLSLRRLSNKELLQIIELFELDD